MWDETKDEFIFGEVEVDIAEYEYHGHLSDSKFSNVSYVFALQQPSEPDREEVAKKLKEKNITIILLNESGHKVRVS